MVWCHLMILDTMTQKANRAVDGAILALSAVHLDHIERKSKPKCVWGQSFQQANACLLPLWSLSRRRVEFLERMTVYSTQSSPVAGLLENNSHSSISLPWVAVGDMHRGMMPVSLHHRFSCTLKNLGRNEHQNLCVFHKCLWLPTEYNTCVSAYFSGWIT